MKKYLHAALFLTFATFATAQSVEVIEPMTFVEGQILISNDYEIDVHWDIINTSESDVSISCRRELISEVDGSRNKFCWGPLCFGYETDESPDGTEALIAAGATNTTFHGYYEHQGNVGDTEIKYCFFNVNDADDEACVTTVYSITQGFVGVEEVEALSELNNVSPNPVVGLSTFTYKISGKSNNNQITIYNMVGSIVKEIPLSSSQGVVILNGQDFEAGIYLYSLVVDGQKVSTKRMIVAK